MTSMALDAISAPFANCVPPEWLPYLVNLDSPVGLPSADFEQELFSQVTFEATLPFPPSDPVYQDESLMDVQPDVQPTDGNENTDIPAATPPVTPPVTPPPTPPSPPSSHRCHKIPQRAYKKNQWNYTQSGPILFQVNGSPGMNMGAALRGKFTGLEGRDDLVMKGAKRAFACRFLFPGYPRKSYQIFTTYWNRKRDPIERSKLAREVAKRLKKYLDSMVLHIVDPSANREWQIGEGFMQLDNIFLARLESVSRGSYQPVFYVVEPALEESHVD